MKSNEGRPVLSVLGLLAVVLALAMTVHGYGAGRTILPRQLLLYVVLGTSVVGHLLVALGNRRALRILPMLGVAIALLILVLMLIPPIDYDPDDPPGPLNYLAVFFLLLPCLSLVSLAVAVPLFWRTCSRFGLHNRKGGLLIRLGAIVVIVVSIGAAARTVLKGYLYGSDNMGSHRLYSAVFLEREDEVRRLLSLGADVNYPTADGDTALHAASMHHDTKLMKLLLSKGADVSARNEFGDTPLHTAAKWGRCEAARMLIDSGADVNARAKKGFTPLHELVNSSIRDSEETDLELGYYKPPHLGEWARTAELLIKSGADVDVKNDWGDTPLHEAAYEDRVDVVKVLLEAGAAVDARNKHGDTPLRRALFCSNKQVAELLRQHGGHE